MGDASLRAAATELRLRAGHRVVAAVVGFACVMAVGQGLAPVLVNGDPIARGLGSWLFGAAAGTGAGVIVALAVTVWLIGGDIDREWYSERLRTGTRPLATALSQGFSAVIAGVLTWAITAVVGAVGGAAELVLRALTGTPVHTPPPPASVVLIGVAGPGAVVVTVMATWIVVVAARGAVNTGIAMTTAVVLFTIGLATLPTSIRPALALNPIGPLWRAISGTDIGSSLPGAVHDSPAPYIASAVGWGVVTVIATVRRARTLGMDR